MASWWLGIRAEDYFTGARGSAARMARFGYTMMTEQSPPDELVRDVQMAEEAGFDFSVTSDHYQPWLDEQGHSGYAWSILGAAAQATESIELMTYVTCPTIRYHPAVVAQKAATMQILSNNRFRLGLGAGENLNEHVVGKGWPAVGIRHEMLSEAVDIISELFGGDGSVNYRGRHFDVEQVRLWDVPDKRVPIGIAVSGPDSCRLAGQKGDLMIAVEPERELGEMFDAAGGEGKPRVGQVALAYDEDRDAAVQRAHEQFRWFGLGWKVNADLPNPESFDSATQFVTPEQVSESLGCGPDVEEHVEKIRPFVDAGFTEVALVQIGADQQSPFVSWAERELLPALRSL
jgi:G6PDH family F420-dependent oxidoreductase